MAGGAGTGLSVLCERRAKPAVPIAGGYRLIDFALSKAAAPGVAQVAVLAQYLPPSLVRHIGEGAPWDLARRPPHGVQIWHPHRGRGEGGWYGGTADALYQNRSLIAASGIELVLIVCGDHVYKQDYRDMLRFHRETGADMTIAVTQVRPEDTHRFGIATVDDTYRIRSFVEKPKASASTLASMGIYVFGVDFLLQRLEEDARNPSSSHEVGADLIPRMIVEDRIFAYPFAGLWIDVGTVAAYWETNLGLVAERPPIDLHDSSWPILTRAEVRPPAWHTSSAEVRESLVSPGCVIEGAVFRSVLSPGVRIEPGAVVRDSVVLHDAVVRAGASVDRCVLDRGAEIGAGARLGVGTGDRPNDRDPQRLCTGISLVGMRAHIPGGAIVGRNCVIASEAGEPDFDRLEIPGGTTLDRR